MERARQARRRQLLAAMAGTVSMTLCAGSALAGGDAGRFPERPVRIIVPFSAGGVVDSVTRIAAQRMAQILHQPVIVENKVGAGGAIGTDFVAKAQPDGYTLLAVSPSHVMGPMLNTAVSWDPVRDFRAIAGFGVIPNVIVVPAGSTYHDLGALIGAARSHPGDITYASAGIGTSNHLSAELLAQMSGVRMTHVPYKGQPEALNDLLGARVSMMALTVAIARPQVQSGKLTALAITSSRRSPAFPSVPTVAEAARIPGYEVGAWFGLVAPRKTPDDIVRKLGDAVASALSGPEMTSRLADLGMDVSPQSAPAFDRYIASESRKWHGVLQKAGISTQ